MRVALYLRVSTSRQALKDLSIPDQQRQGASYCQAKGWTVVREFVEPGATATDDRRRPAFHAMMDAALSKDRDFDVILVHSYSRFFRDAIELEFNLRRLRKNGVRLVSMTQETGDDPMSELVRRILALFDEYSSKENGKHTLRCMKENARQGFWNGSRPPFGYCTIEAERRGDKVKKRLAIDPEEAEIVRLIFKLHRHGIGAGRLGVKAIAAHLNAQGLRYRDGKRFSTGLVHRLLTREAYVGRHYFNRTHAKTGEAKEREEWVEFAMPPIIDQKTFAEVQRSLEERNPKKTPPRVISSPVLLTGLAKCETCGGGMQLRTGKSGQYRYYTCSTCARQGKEVCPGRSVPMDLLDGLVLDHLVERLFVPERMTVLLEQHAEQRKAAACEGAAGVKLIEKELREAEEGLRRLYEAIQKGLIPLDETLQAHVAELRERRDQLARRKEAAEVERQVIPALVPARQIGAFCALMRDELHGADVQVRKALLRLFVSEIAVGDTEVRLAGRVSALETGARRHAEIVAGEVPSFVREWRPRRDSNPRPQD